MKYIILNIFLLYKISNKIFLLCEMNNKFLFIEEY
jgi:hypothetical protein